MLRIALAAALLASPAAAKDVLAPSSILAVTVFPRGAEVVRVADVAAPAGASVIVVQDLPAEIDPDSVQVEGDMTGGVEITSVDASRIFIKKPGLPGLPDATERRRLEAEAQALKDERAALDGAVESAKAQKTLAQNLAKLPVSGPRGGESGAQPDWPVLFDLIGNRLVEAQKALLAAQVRQRGIDEKIKEIEERLNREPPEETERTEVRVFLEAAGEAKGRLRIRYRSENASWRPGYDARLTTGDKPALALSRRAHVAQDTGEDWNEVQLMLSTARPGGATAAPSLRPIIVEFEREAPLPKAMMRAPAPAGAPPAEGFAAESADREVAGYSAARVAIRPAVIEASTYQAIFKIASKATIKSGVGDKKVLIANETLKPTVKVISAPKENTTAFLNANFIYQGEAALLPGDVSLYRDNVYVGAGALPLIAAGQEHNLGFGPDDSVKVNRISVKREKGETGVLTSSNVDEQHFSITVKNLHAKPVAVMVLDQMPYSEDEKIVVEMLPVTTPPSETNHEDKRGVVVWEMELRPGEERALAFSYQINWPAKREIVTAPR
ncbi:MAG: mucoidy inhibitor MuiA family protein [Hyphomicrobiales bacterium]|nr:mucoidy inhibitor MuiA family protein [Hyphomicrobiales bacterium]